MTFVAIGAFRLNPHLAVINKLAYFYLFDLVLYVPVNIFSVMLGRVFLG